MADGVLYARTAVVNGQTGAIVPVGAPVAATSEGTAYSQTLSGTTVTIPAGAASSGAIESNSARYYWTLASLGWTMTVAEPRQMWVRFEVDSMTDGGEARSGTAGMGVFLGTASTTAIWGTGLIRTSSGTSYNTTLWAGTGSALTAGPANASNVAAGLFADIGSTSTGNRDANAYSSANVRLANSNTSGATIPSGAPTHLVVYLRRESTTPSAVVLANPRALIMPLVGGI